ncbi:energy transducer TonB [Flavobacterium sp.]
MSNVSIYGKKWIDLVFENRNKKYGAYQLRQENPRVTLLALFYGVLLFGGFAVVLIISNLKSSGTDVATETTYPEDFILKVTNFKLPSAPKIKEAVKKTIVNAKILSVKQPINLLSNLVVVESQQAVDVPTNKEVEATKPSATQGAIATLGNGTDSGKSNGELTSANEVNTENEIVNKSNEVDKIPSFPGGINKFYHYVASNFRNQDLESAVSVSVIVAFVVEKDGTLSNIKVIRNSGNGVDKEAIRVLSAMRIKWTPGFKNGEKVRTEFTLPIKVKFD